VRRAVVPLPGAQRSKRWQEHDKKNVVEGGCGRNEKQTAETGENAAKRGQRATSRKRPRVLSSRRTMPAPLNVTEGWNGTARHEGAGRGGNVASLIRSSPRSHFWGEKRNALTDMSVAGNPPPVARHPIIGCSERGGRGEWCLATGQEGERERSGDTCAIGARVDLRQTRYFSVARRFAEINFSRAIYRQLERSILASKGRKERFFGKDKRSQDTCRTREGMAVVQIRSRPHFEEHLASLSSARFCNFAKLTSAERL